MDETTQGPDWREQIGAIIAPLEPLRQASAEAETALEELRTDSRQFHADSIRPEDLDASRNALTAYRNAVGTALQKLRSMWRSTPEDFADAVTANVNKFEKLEALLSSQLSAMSKEAKGKIAEADTPLESPY